MAKRFLETTIFEKKWFRQLTPKLKLGWFYIINKCNHAGIWECDIDLMSFQVGEQYTLDEILDSFGDNIVSLGDDKYFLTKFIAFQYGLPLNPRVKVHQSVIKVLAKYNIDIEKDNKEKTISKNLTIDQRKEIFVRRVEAETNSMNVDSKLFSEFIAYWTEHNNKSMRFEKQSFFNPKRRMSTWIRNSEKFNASSRFNPVDEDLLKKEMRLEAEYKEQQERFRKINSQPVASSEEINEILKK